MELRHVVILTLLGAFFFTFCFSQSVDEEERLEGVEGSGNLGLDDEDRVEGSGLPPETYPEKKPTTVRPKPSTKKVDENNAVVERTTKSTTVSISTKTSPAFETKAGVSEVTSTKAVEDLPKVTVAAVEGTTASSSESALSQIDSVTLLIIVTAVVVVIIIVAVLIFIVKKRSGSNRDYKPGVPVNRT